MVYIFFIMDDNEVINSLNPNSQELCMGSNECQSKMGLQVSIPLSESEEYNSEYNSSQVSLSDVTDNLQEVNDDKSNKCNRSSPSGDEYLSAVCKIVEEVEALHHSNELIKDNNIDKLVEEDSTIVTDLADSSQIININSSLKCSEEEDPGVNKDLNLNDESKPSDSDSSTYLPDGFRIIRISGASKEFKCKIGMKDLFLKGCKWAPDGTCLLTSCEDKWLRIFDLPSDLYTEKVWSYKKTLPDLNNTVKVKTGGRIYDFCWYSKMNSWTPETCCFFTSTAGEPVHLWDAYNGTLRASYRAVNYADELVSPLSITCSPDGVNLFAGFKNKFHVYDVALGGIKPTVYNIKELAGQSGLVSTIAVNPTLPSLFAVGTYEKSVGLYSSLDKSGICVFSGHSGGLTHMLFSPDGSRLYTGSRSDQEIVCWDLRTPGKVLFSLSRNVTTHQRVYFDLTPDGKMLITGNTDGCVCLWNLEENRIISDQEPLLSDYSFTAHNDCTNGVSINKHYPVLATSSGQRHVPDLISYNDSEDDSNETDESSYFFDYNSMEKRKENCVKVWWIGRIQEEGV